jgi:tetratricopeptide (TPR) repeat protein
MQVAVGYWGELLAHSLPFDTLNLGRRDELVAGICENAAYSWAARQRSLWLAPVQVIEGRWDELALALAVIDANPGVAVNGLAALSILPWIGNTELLERVTRDQLPELWDTARGSAYYGVTVELQRINAEAALMRGDSSTMRSWVDAYDRWMTWAGDLSRRPNAARLRAEYHRSAGDLAEARRCAEEALRLAGEPRQPLEELAATRLLGELDTAERSYARAALRLDAALSIALAARAPFEAALTWIAQAELSIATGHGGHAKTLLIDARDVCEPLHAVPVLQRIAMLEAKLP